MRAATPLLLLLLALISSVGVHASPPQEIGSASKPSPAHFEGIATGAASLRDFIDPARGIAMIDLVPDQRDGSVAGPTLLCGKELSAFASGWTKRMKEELKRMHEEHQSVACEPAFGGLSCSLGAIGEWDPAHHFVFLPAGPEHYRLAAVIDDDEVMVEEEEIEETHRRASALLAELLKSSCASGGDESSNTGIPPDKSSTSASRTHELPAEGSEGAADPEQPMQAATLGSWTVAVLPYETSSYLSVTRAGDEDMTLQVELGCATVGPIEMTSASKDVSTASAVVALVPVSHEFCDDEDPAWGKSGVLVLRLAGTDACAVSTESNLERARAIASQGLGRLHCPKKRCDFNLGPCPVARVGRIGNFLQRWPKLAEKLMEDQRRKELEMARAAEEKLLSEVPRIGTKCTSDMKSWVDTTTALRAAASSGRPKLVDQLEKKRTRLATAVCAAAQKLRNVIRIYQARDLEDAARAVLRSYGECVSVCRD